MVVLWTLGSIFLLIDVILLVRAARRSKRLKRYEDDVRLAYGELLEKENSLLLREKELQDDKKFVEEEAAKLLEAPTDDKRRARFLNRLEKSVRGIEMMGGF